MLKKFKIKVNKKLYEVEVEELNSIPETHINVATEKKTAKNITMVLASTPEHLNSLSLATKEIIAPLPGLIVDVLVKEGAKLKIGDKILVLEAMKMENAIVAMSDSIIDKIHVKKGDLVNGNQLMVTLQ